MSTTRVSEREALRSRGLPVREDGARQTARSDAFRVLLSDALRPLGDPLGVQSEAARVLGEHLSASRAAYVEVKADNDSAWVQREYCVPGMSSLIGRWKLDDFGPTLIAQYRAGHTFAVADVSAIDALSDAERARFSALTVAAFASVPLLKQGRLMAILTVHSAMPREWSAEDLALIEETAERTWAAVQRARAEQALRESEAKYRSLFDSIDEGIAILQPIFDAAGIARDFLFVETNRAFERQSGVAGTGKRALELRPNLEPWWFEAIGQVAITKVPVRLERFAPTTGKWFGVYVNSLGDGENHQVAVVFDDITRRKRREANAAFLADIQDELARVASAEDIIRAVGAKLGTFMKLLSCHLAELDFARDEARISHIWHDTGSLAAPSCHNVSACVNEAVERLYAAGKPFLVFDTEADPRIDARNSRAQGVGSLIGMPYQRKDQGVSVFVVADRAPRDWREDEIELLRELSDRFFQRLQRARADASLRATELRLQETLEAAGMGTFVWHSGDDRTEADPRLLRLFGLPAEGTLNLRLALCQLLHPDDRERCAGAMARAMDPLGPGTLRDDVRVRHPDGSWHWLAITAHAAFAGDGTVRLTGMALDVSERRFTEDALRRSEQQLKESDRRKDEFLAVLAHELRNPLAPIRTGLELLRMSGDTPESVGRVRRVMERQVSHVVRLVDDLLDVSRINSGNIRLQRQLTPLHTLVGTAVEAHRAALDAGQLQLQLHLPEQPVTLDVDPTRFVQVLSNILHNAIKFTDAGGRIRIGARVSHASGATAAPGETAQRLSLIIEDSGSGIAPELLPRVFQLFIQGDPAPRSSGGLGIGLALARRLIEMHAGSIQAFSSGPGQGSRFVIELPLPPTDNAAKPMEDSAGATVIDLRVVVIDDNADAADTMALLIEASGGKCRVAYDGESGLQRVLEFRPDAVLLDIGMPGMDGYETCRRIRSSYGAAPLMVALTGWGQDRDKEQALQAGFDHHLTKPAHPALLRQLLAGVRRTAPRAEPSGEPC